MATRTLDFERCYRAVESRDARFDGWFITAVVTTGIYCRPSCPTPVRPKRQNVRFYPTAAAAQLAGFRACKRCRPDASPGSPEWNVRGDLVGRAMRLIADGVIDRDGVAGVARRLMVSERHLHRLLVSELGAGPLAIARAQRAQIARTLIETTALPFTDVAFAAGFDSIRQFNDTVREVFALAPTELRAAGRRRGERPNGSLVLRLPYRAPLDWPALLSWLGTRAIPGVAETDGAAYRRTLRLPGGAAIVELEPVDGHIRCTMQLETITDLAAAVLRCRRLLDLDADPTSVCDVLSTDRCLGPLVRRNPGLRAPGTVDGTELAMQAILGQQVSLAAARTLSARLVTAKGELIKIAHPTLTHLFPTAAAIADADLPRLGMPASRRSTLAALAQAVVDGDLALDPGADRTEVSQRLTALPGIGQWTAGYIVMRALGDPDTFLPTDLGIRKAGAMLGLGNDPKTIAARAAAWSPWRTYATHHLWASLASPIMKGAA
ncbi:MAG: helix-turn-helix domain-containing protein [Candidatus Dormibacteraeota bacterium]|nr:helix-turn-helix domain-containing protein [Candidatus Dormibacteraeota bacterium]